MAYPPSKHMKNISIISLSEKDSLEDQQSNTKALGKALKNGYKIISEQATSDTIVYILKK